MTLVCGGLPQIAHTRETGGGGETGKGGEGEGVEGRGEGEGGGEGGEGEVKQELHLQFSPQNDKYNGPRQMGPEVRALSLFMRYFLFKWH